MGKPILLDLFCGSGGASCGYMDAGFDVIGVDINPQPRYIGGKNKFCQMDVLKLEIDTLKDFDAIHSSPPCQAFSKMKSCWQDREHPDLISQVREMLIASGKPYIIENVPQAPLIDPIILCGSMFKGLEVRRHRAFESNFPIPHLKCEHSKIPYAVPVYGHTGAGANRNRERERGRSNTVEDWRRAMGISWMTAKEIAQAIPPAYTEFIGRYLMEELCRSTGEDQEI